MRGKAQATAPVWGLRLAGLLLALGLGGCASGNVVEQVELDRSIVTGSVARPSPAPDTTLATDAETIRNAATSAALPLAAPLSWASVGTGSEGVVTEIAETGGGRSACRRFSATRESYDGVSVHSGEACLVADGRWALKSFQ